ncbi:MAG: response regulator [Chloroflexi bacterium]|nr:response regulator [Chloroflexota bacterium]
MNSIILIVDDDPSSRFTLESILEGQDYSLYVAEDGKRALEQAEALKPDLILMDVMMPGMDGFEVCRRIRATPALAEAPILLLTALDDNASRLRGIEAGADDFLTKPIDRQELRARVRTITRLNRYRTLLEQRESLREMAQKLVTAQELERQRISRELHDELGQALTAHLIGLRLLQTDFSSQDSALHERLEPLILDTVDILNRMRQLAQDLRPPAVDTLDLPSALDSFCQEYSRRLHLPILFEAEPLPSVSDVIAITLYRFLQEALTNVARHAQATRVWVDLSTEDQSVSLTVQDNGQGFQENSHMSGIGIQGMRERLTIAGGSLTLRSAPGRGTVITASLPISATEAK